MDTVKSYILPVIGMGSGFGAFYLKFIEVGTPIIEFFALVTGFLIALVILGIKYKELRKLG